MPKNDELRYGAPGETAVHLCVDMQRMFAEGTDWKMPWLERVLPNILSITSTHPEKTIFTRFIPARKPGQGVGMWRHYYERWGSMTIDQLGSEMIGLVPDLAKYEGGEYDDNYRHRMMVNLAALGFTAVLAVAAVWLVIQLADMRKNQDCVLSGRRNCAPIDVKALER